MITGNEFAMLVKLYTVMYTILLLYRANIESSYGSQVDQLRKEYTQEEKELIKKYLAAKKSCCLTPECPDQKMDSSLAQNFVLKEESEKGLHG